MYSKQQASQLRRLFWTRFGQYMRPVMGANGETVNWVNYHTGIKGVFFRMDADTTSASIAIELKDTDKERQLQHYSILEQLKPVIEEETEEEWEWKENVRDEKGDSIHRIGVTLKAVNILREEDWPAIISFFKPRIIALDEFWQLVKESFR